MQIRAYIHHFIIIGIIFTMVACATSSHFPHAPTSDAEEVEIINIQSNNDTSNLQKINDSITSSTPAQPVTITRDSVIHGKTTGGITSPDDSLNMEVLIFPDSTILNTDSTTTVIPQDSTTVSNDSVTEPKPMFSDIITYNADDSIRISILEKKMFLYKNAYVKYLQTELTADYIELDMQENIAYASGLPDSTGTMIGTPKFKDGSQEFESLDLRYNFKTKKGFVKEIITQQGEGYIQGKLTKKMSDSIYCIKDGLYTTCDQHDHPHFHIRLRKAKMIKDKKVVSGFANLYIEDVPLPLAIPFGFFPITKKGTSGVIMPTYGEERLRGFNLRDGGYYFFINDYIDLALTGTIYSNGSWGTNISSNYRKKYKFSGTFNFNMSKNHTSEKGTPDYTESSDWALRWNHTQDAKANPYTTFSASVDMSSASNNYYNSSNINDIANQRKQSSISWSKKWPDKPFSITAGFTHNQNSQDTTISLAFPNLNFRVSQIYPLRKKERVGKMKWYENIGFTYNAQLKHSITTHEKKLGESFQNMARDWVSGFHHNIPLSTSFNLLKDLSFSPSFTYEGAAALSTVRIGDWVADTTMPGRGYNPRDTSYGLFYAHNYKASASLSYNPTIYGMYQFKPDKKIYAIRHVIRPSASVSYTPKMGVRRSKYYKTYIDDKGIETEYSIFTNKAAFGIPSGNGVESGSVSLSLDNNLEMKVRNDQDTTGDNEFKKVALIESFRASTSYDMFKDTLNWGNIQLSFRTKIINGRVNINVSGTLDPYALTAKNERINKYNGGLGRLTNVSASSGIQFSSDKGQKKEEKNDRLNGHYDLYMDFEVPWSISLDYTFNYSRSYSANNAEGATKPLHTNNISQMVRVNGDFSLTPKMKLGYSTGYDFKNKEITATSFNISRDLHCWEMTFSCIPFGTHQSYNFQINVRSSLLQDLKLMKRDSWYDQR